MTQLVPNPPTPLGPLHVMRLAQAWQRDPIDSAKGGRFVQYLRNFLESLGNPNTNRSYRFALLEFWDWIESTSGRLPTPDRVERKDAIRYADWLKTRPFGLDEYRLKRDPQRKLESAIYETVKNNPGAHLSLIRQRLSYWPELFVMVGSERRLLIEADDPAGLDKFLACLVEHTKSLVRTPTVAELRQRDPTLYARLGERIDPELFAYSRNPHTAARGAERASTIGQRLAALSAFWQYLISNTGENVGTSKPLLEHNIWQAPMKDALALAPSHKAVSRALKTPNMGIFARLFATTAPHGELYERSFEDVRDRAVLLFLFHTGVRASELGNLRRGDITGDDPPIVSLTGKGGRARAFVVPAEAKLALDELTAKIEQLATAAERQLNQQSRHARLLQDDAPLFPAVVRWGCNASSERAQQEAGLTRQAIAMMMRRRAEKAGIQKGTADFAKVHPHGIRHLAAERAEARGVPVSIIQAVLGHRSMATTGQYVEKRDPRLMNLSPTPVDVPPVPEARTVPVSPEPVPTSPPSITPKRPKRPEIIETTGVPVPETPAPSIAPLLTPVPSAPAPRPVLPAERLVAMGGQLPPKRPLPSTVEIEAIEAGPGAFDKVYTTNWGDEKTRSVLHKKKQELPGTDIGARDDLLVHTYVGNPSGLVWWAGPAGKLKPELPIASPSQLLATGRGSFHHGLEQLWTSWFMGDKGPTAASALLSWLEQSLAVTEQAAVELRVRDGEWLPYDVPAQLTKDTSNFREHREDKMVLWYELRGYSFMAAPGRGGTVRGERVGRARDDAEPPEFGPKGVASWYYEPDPVRSLPDDERADLFDWLLVLMGQAPISRTLRFRKTPGAPPTISRVDVAMFLGMLCSYDSARDALQTAYKGHMDLPAAKALVTRTRDFVNAEVAKLGIESFDVATLASKRVAEREELVAATVEGEAATKKKKEMRRTHYMRLVEQVFGAEAAADETSSLFALCKGQPLFGVSLPKKGSGDYASLFRIDPMRQTIVHDPTYAIAFARATGTHSECVARRMARHLWELRKAGKLAARAGRKTELREMLDTWAYYKVACPATLESELRARLGGQNPVDLDALFPTVDLREKPSAKVVEATLASGSSEAIEAMLAASDIQHLQSLELSPRGTRLLRRAVEEMAAASPEVAMGLGGKELQEGFAIRAKRAPDKPKGPSIYTTEEGAKAEAPTGPTIASVKRLSPEQFEAARLAGQKKAGPVVQLGGAIPKRPVRALTPNERGALIANARAFMPTPVTLIFMLCAR